MTMLDMRETYQNVVPILVNDIAVGTSYIGKWLVLDVDVVHRLIHGFVDEVLGIGRLDGGGWRVERVVGPHHGLVLRRVFLLDDVLLGMGWEEMRG